MPGPDANLARELKPHPPIFHRVAFLRLFNTMLLNDALKLLAASCVECVIVMTVQIPMCDESVTEFQAGKPVKTTVKDQGGSSTFLPLPHWAREKRKLRKELDAKSAVIMMTLDIKCQDRAVNEDPGNQVEETEPPTHSLLRTPNLLVPVFSHLSPFALATASCCSLAWREAAGCPSLWRQHCLRLWPSLCGANESTKQSTPSDVDFSSLDSENAQQPIQTVEESPPPIPTAVQKSISELLGWRNFFLLRSGFTGGVPTSSATSSNNGVPSEEFISTDSPLNSTGTTGSPLNSPMVNPRQWLDEHLGATMLIDFNLVSSKGTEQNGLCSHCTSEILKDNLRVQIPIEHIATGKAEEAGYKSKAERMKELVCNIFVDWVIVRHATGELAVLLQGFLALDMATGGFQGPKVGRIGRATAAIKCSLMVVDDERVYAFFSC